jgi:hypothetical protein
MAIRFALKVMRVVQLLGSGFAVLVVGRSHVLEALFAHRVIFAAIQRHDQVTMATRIAMEVIHVVRILDSGFALLVGRSHVLEERLALDLLLDAAME